MSWAKSWGLGDLLPLHPALKSLRENCVVPGGLWLFFPLTQHSAFGYVLGYDMSRLRRLIFVGHTPPTKMKLGTHTDSEALGYPLPRLRRSFVGRR